MPDNSWNDLVAHLPGAHILQTRQWGQVKNRFGWKPFYMVWDQYGKVQEAHVDMDYNQNTENFRAAALVLQRFIKIPFLPLRFSVLYIPKGPVLDWNDVPLRSQVLLDLIKLGRSRKTIFLKIDPDICLGKGIPNTAMDRINISGQAIVANLIDAGWKYSDEQIQFQNTVMINLDDPPEILMAKMKQKTRYNIRLAERKGVTIRKGTTDDLPVLLRMYAETSLRDGFIIREQSYYHYVWETFIRAGMAEPLIAEVDNQIVAALILFVFAEKAWYLYGMSSELHRDKMPNYLLQWHAILHAQSQGCKQYDLWGAPDKFDNTDPMCGVYRFKEGLGGDVIRHIGAWDYIISPGLYRAYTQVIPRLLDIMRHRGNEKTHQLIQS